MKLHGSLHTTRGTRHQACGMRVVVALVAEPRAAGPIYHASIHLKALGRSFTSRNVAQERCETISFIGTALVYLDSRVTSTGLFRYPVTSSGQFYSFDLSNLGHQRCSRK